MNDSLRNFHNSVDSVDRVVRQANLELMSNMSNSDVRRRFNFVSCSSLVLLSGMFESFFRDVARDYISLLCQRRVDFYMLSKHVKKTHLKEGGILVGHVANSNPKYSWIESSPDNITHRLNSVYSDRTNYLLVWEAFANTGSNPGAEATEKFLQCLGVARVRQKLNEKLQADTNSNNGYSSVVKVKLDSLMKMRNECAHTGRIIEMPTYQVIRDYCEMLKNISKAMIEILYENLNQTPILDLNTACAKDLMRVPGIGKHLARKIVLLRDSGLDRRFDHISQLKQINGVGDVLFDRISPFLTIASDS